eukprot:COSAG02_NODE_8792_length_2443_cov_2.902304_3_plen_100_part_00
MLCRVGLLPTKVSARGTTCSRAAAAARLQLVRLQGTQATQAVDTAAADTAAADHAVHSHKPMSADPRFGVGFYSDHTKGCCEWSHMRLVRPPPGHSTHT